jgi:hypothetical protein
MTKPYQELSEREEREFRRKHPELNLGFTEEEKREIEREMRRIDARIQAEKRADERAEAAAEREHERKEYRWRTVDVALSGGFAGLAVYVSLDRTIAAWFCAVAVWLGLSSLRKPRPSQYWGAKAQADES